MTLKAKQEIENADVIVGYKTYVKLIEQIIKPDTEVFSGNMGQEVDRARKAIQKAQENKKVAVISSGDAGVYGMAGVVLETAAHEKAKVSIEVVPGVTAATAAAATLGAPLVGDFAAISLSDILTPWDLIERRLRAAAEADFGIVLYNPQSMGRKMPLEEAHKILLEYRDPKTHVGIVKNAKRAGEKVTITCLKEMMNFEIDMATILVIGNSKTYVIDHKLVTPRGYSF
ncbi:MAG: precorrin-3B C(17)-methyltransferase [Candidatus Bathyarchaeota archaeon]|nr:precorrin-3B C(17)-methyltransferase [Candidatus Bathyarchaeum tardum]WGM90670.1 MAG: precorrin-3B C(17)-methyltransferase [Candidatus Bathyarchaeum tardum]